MKRFSIEDSCSIGFQEHVTLDPTADIELQLHRRRLQYRQDLPPSVHHDFMSIIEWNSSLRVGFGWGFDPSHLGTIMDECEKRIVPSFTGNICRIVSDPRHSWIGFVPFNTFDQFFYVDLCLEDLVSFNNNLINFQIEVIKFIVAHPLYNQYSIVSSDKFRFQFFKEKRKNPIALSDAFQYYVDSIKTVTKVPAINREAVELTIGCHYLHHPDIFFQALNFNKLRGCINE